MTEIIKHVTGVVKKFSSYCKFASKAVHILILLEAPSKVGKIWKNLYIYLFILFNCSNASVNKFPRFEPFNDLIKKYPIRTFQLELSFRDTTKFVISSRKSRYHLLQYYSQNQYREVFFYRKSSLPLLTFHPGVA